MEPTNVIFFESPAELRKWLTEHADKETELWVGMHRKATGKPSVSWAQIVDQALCFGWIDGIRKSIDAEDFAQRLTPAEAPFGLSTFFQAVPFHRSTSVRSSVPFHQVPTAQARLAEMALTPVR
jgi:hypothetical protein